MSAPDIRWKQRFSTFQCALKQFAAAIQEANRRPLSALEKLGLIQTYKFTHELAWNVMRDYFIYQGDSQIMGSRDATREAFQKGLISDGDVWMEMIKSRNQTSHTYNTSVAEDIVAKIQTSYFSQFNSFQEKMIQLAKK